MEFFPRNIEGIKKLVLLGYELYVLCVLALEGGVYTLHARENCIYYGHWAGTTTLKKKVP